MGTFQGHVLPGTFFLLFGVWWTIRITWRYLASSRGGDPYRNMVYQPAGWGRLKNWPFESVVKLLCPLFGLAGEIYASYNYGKSSHVVAFGDLQHATMYGFFILAGIVDIIVYYRLLPPGTDYVTNIMAFIVEGLLFTFHLHGRSPVDVHLHTLLSYVIFGCVITAGLEMLYPTHVLAGFARACAVLFQGTWFWQLAFALYNPFPWARGNYEQHTEEETVMVYTLMFTWHFGGIILSMGFICALVRVCYLKCSVSGGGLCTRCCNCRDTAKYRLLERETLLESDTDNALL